MTNNILVLGPDDYRDYYGVIKFFNENSSLLLHSKPTFYAQSEKGLSNLMYLFFRQHELGVLFKNITHDNAMKKNILKEVNKIMVFNDCVGDNLRLINEARRKKIDVEFITI